ncbi:RmlC-like cupin domain-containing protein [Lineolata rhizophorae]|uniref:Cysteine dioxygenase n=1 Tax=Lineolata rhizophorae TaxID=578093 RepID=A0A6A6NW06_9PEZI|nr:RmlC-like cupin domain-containing protein [Lineolata rhizophorae]
MPGKRDCVETASTATSKFQRLVEDLRKELGAGGIDSEDVDPNVLQLLMRQYVSKVDDWQQYALSDFSRPYTRNLVDKGNGKSNLLVLVWTPGRGSAIHDHAGAHCIMKVLKGHLKESLYPWREPTTGGESPRAALEPIQETLYDENEVTYISDKIGLHKISNPSREEVAVSLHLYTPPNAAMYGCHTFDETTGRCSKVHQPNFSEYGHRL